MTTMLRLGLFALVVVSAAGCECGSPMTHPDICALPGAPTGCGALCSPAVACPGTGTHCVDNHCTAECNAAHPCAGGATCSASGTCGAVDASVARDTTIDSPIVPHDAPPADHTCAATSVGTTLATPNVIVIVDQSGSMGTNNFPTTSTTSRWDALQNALMANPDGLIFSLQTAVRWGMAWFHGGNMCPNNTHTVDCALNNYTALNTQYNMLAPGGNTPTGEAIDYVVAHLDTIIDDPTQPTIFILATDGDPNTCASNSDTTGGQMHSVSAVTAAFHRTPSIPTYVISVGTDSMMANLQAVADAGNGGTGGHVYLATDTATLSAALTTIVGGVVSCNLALGGMIDPAQACSGTVTLGTPPMTLGCGDPNGWHAVDATHIQLDGTACTMLLAGSRPLNATFPCGVILM